jgi:hypothetical protein
VNPGDKLEGPVPFTVCSTINDLSKDVLIPSFIVDGVVKAAGLTPVWPLGVFVIFTEEGLTVCVYGKDEHGEFDTKRNTIELLDDVIPPIGEAVWKMWKELRSTPEEDLVIGLSTLKSLTGEC